MNVFDMRSRDNLDPQAILPFLMILDGRAALTSEVRDFYVRFMASFLECLFVPGTSVSWMDNPKLPSTLSSVAECLVSLQGTQNVEVNKAGNASSYTFRNQSILVIHHV